MTGGDLGAMGLRRHWKASRGLSQEHDVVGWGGPGGNVEGIVLDA